MDIIFFDTETTGLKPGQICQLSLIKETDNNFVYARNYFFEVNQVEPSAEKVHGFSVENLKLLSGGKKFRDYAEEIRQEFTGSVLVAHNISFDERFIGAEFWRCNMDSYLPLSKVDTMATFKDILKIPSRSARYGKYKSPKLSEVMDYLHIDPLVVQQYTKKLFDADETAYHDSRYDTACLYILTNVYREVSQNVIGFWRRTFCGGK